MRMLIAGGGTGGHLFPGIALGEAFCAAAPGTGEPNELLFVGSPRGIEARVLSERGLPLETIEVGQLKGRSLLQKLQTLLALPAALLRAARIVWRFGPDVVVGVGGYVSGPVLLAARLLGKKTAIQEQNASAGLTNRLLGRVVHLVFTAFEGAAANFPARKVRLLGNPIRCEIVQASEEATPLPEEPAVLVLGGSQGARPLNEVLPGVYAILKAKRAGLSWTHQCGEAHLEAARAAYEKAGGGARVVAFLGDMAGALAGASLVVGRAGASTLAEICAMGRGSILIPFPFATDNHQEKNARELEATGAAEVVLERDLAAKSLAERIETLLARPEKLEAMAASARGRGRPGAAQEIARECIALAIAS